MSDDRVIRFPTDHRQLSQMILEYVRSTLPGASELSIRELHERLDAYGGLLLERGSDLAVSLRIEERHKRQALDALTKLKHEVRSELFEKVITPLFWALMEAEVKLYRLGPDL